jgi:hypothetical protein
VTREGWNGPEVIEVIGLIGPERTVVVRLLLDQPRPVRAVNEIIPPPRRGRVVREAVSIGLQLRPALDVVVSTTDPLLDAGESVPSQRPLMASPHSHSGMIPPRGRLTRLRAAVVRVEGMENLDALDALLAEASAVKDSRRGGVRGSIGYERLHDVSPKSHTGGPDGPTPLSKKTRHGAGSDLRSGVV